MGIFPFGIEHPLDVMVQRPHDADPRNRAGPVTVGSRVIRYYPPLLSPSSCGTI